MYTETEHLSHKPLGHADSEEMQYAQLEFLPRTGADNGPNGAPPPPPTAPKGHGMRAILASPAACDCDYSDAKSDVARGRGYVGNLI